MTVKEFIQNNRPELIKCITNMCRNCELSDESIEDWIRHNERLYSWAISEGVKDT